MLEQPRSFTKTYGDKAFSVCAPKLWNSLPLDLRKSASLTGFKKELKTYDFKTSNIMIVNRFLIFDM